MMHRASRSRRLHSKPLFWPWLLLVIDESAFQNAMNETKHQPFLYRRLFPSAWEKEALQRADVPPATWSETVFARDFGSEFRVLGASVAMPPKKKQRMNANAKSDGGPVAMTMDDVSPFQLKLKDWVSQVFSLRHGSSEALSWPIEGGGSILSICQRCWKDKTGLLERACRLLENMGIGSELNPIVFEDKYLKTEEWLCA